MKILRTPSEKLPWATIIVVMVTATTTALQLRFPNLIAELERSPTALQQHEWWRLITPLFVQSDGWRQIAFNFPTILILGLIVESILGSSRFLLLYFVGGLVGEIAGYVWQPQGAGSSVAGAALLGSLVPWLIWNSPIQAKFGAFLILVGALALCYFRDIHGPPVLAGFAIALFLFREQKGPSASPIH